MDISSHVTARVSCKYCSELAMFYRFKLNDGHSLYTFNDDMYP